MKQLVINETELEDTAEVIYYMNSSARNVFDSVYSLAHDMRHYAHAVYSEEKGNVHYFSTYGYVITYHPGADKDFDHARFSVAPRMARAYVGDIAGAAVHALREASDKLVGLILPS